MSGLILMVDVEVIVRHAECGLKLGVIAGVHGSLVLILVCIWGAETLPTQNPLVRRRLCVEPTLFGSTELCLSPPHVALLSTCLMVSLMGSLLVLDGCWNFVVVVSV